MAHAFGIGSGGTRLPPRTGSPASSSSSTSTLAANVTSTSLSTPLSTSSLAANNTTTSLSTPFSTSSPSGNLAANSTANSTTPSNTTATQGRAVFAHFIVGNTYNYTVDSWSQDIVLAASKGIDAFALNIGSDAWESSQISNAYAAASKYNGNTTNAAAPFRLFFSFDMGSLPCSTASHASTLQSYIRTYANSTSTFKYNARMLVSTFAGESCRFGASTLNQGWTDAIKPTKPPTNGPLPAVWFVPSFFVDPATFRNLSVIDGAFHWNSGWPMGNYNVTFGPDQSYISNLSGNRTYMAAVSPWFFTHYGPDTFNKNWIYRGDDWHWAQRWELLVQNRSSVPLTQVVTWNDYGESHYVGPIEGIQPMSQGWVNGFDHQGWLDLMQYYIKAYKTGSYPAIAKDRVFLWARLYPVNATASDSVGKPANYPWTQDYLWAVTLLTAPANVTLTCGSSTQRTLVPAGLSKLKLKLSTSCAVNATVARGASTPVQFSPAGFNFSVRPPSYNFNAFVAASPP
ncbi:glycoside hydrolase family 71 protein [Polyporus arcularius HHB13444]|uniref:Glycoside hydrolase family 71 protein n=1 Tax=Polyporus arcularius HHB13444 TaxID=1314778 RepID=A0A5C3P9W4_9APHY|nr:glycoside hydrolase family 71 protein [Polyporus arcularius HHB13444]